MNIKRILISGVVIWIVGTVFGILTCGWLFNGVYTLPPKIWKDPTMMMSAGNMIGAILTGLAIAIIFALVYALLYKGIPGKGPQKRYDVWTPCLANRSVVRNSVNAILYDNSNNCSCVLDNTSFGT